MKSLQISEFISEVGTDNGTQDISSLSESESSSVVSDSLWPHGLYSSWNPPGQNTEVGSLSFLQGIFPTQGSNPSLPHCRQILYQLNHKGSPYPISSIQVLVPGSAFWRIQTGTLALTFRLKDAELTTWAGVQVIVVQLLSHVLLLATPWTACSTSGFPVLHHLPEFAQRC